MDARRETDAPASSVEAVDRRLRQLHRLIHRAEAVNREMRSALERLAVDAAEVVRPPPAALDRHKRASAAEDALRSPGRRAYLFQTDWDPDLRRRRKVLVVAFNEDDASRHMFDRRQDVGAWRSFAVLGRHELTAALRDDAVPSLVTSDRRRAP